MIFPMFFMASAFIILTNIRYFKYYVDINNHIVDNYKRYVYLNKWIIDLNKRYIDITKRYIEL